VCVLAYNEKCARRNFCEDTIFQPRINICNLKCANGIINVNDQSAVTLHSYRPIFGLQLPNFIMKSTSSSLICIQVCI